MTPTSLDLAKAELWRQITNGYPRDPVTNRTTYVVDANNAPVLADLAAWMVDAPCRWAVSGCGIMIAGNVGTGKTDLMRALSRCITAGGGTGFDVVSASEIVAKHDRSGKDTEEAGSGIILRYGNRPADLCIDDLGNEPEGKHYGAVRDVLVEVIGLRYNLWKRAGYLTHFTTNIKDDEALLKRYGQRTVDRILEMTRVMPLDGDSRRVDARPVRHERPVLFEVPPPMPTPEEQAAQAERVQSWFRRLREVVEAAAALMGPKVVQMNTHGEHFAQFVAMIGEMDASELADLGLRIEEANPEEAAAPYLKAIREEVKRRSEPQSMAAAS